MILGRASQGGGGRHVAQEDNATSYCHDVGLAVAGTSTLLSINQTAEP